MKKNTSILFAVILSAILFSSCSKELTRVNTDPNNLEKPDATTMLSNTIVSEFYNNANVVWGLGNGYDQYMTYSSAYYNQPTRYLPVTNEPYWIAMYEAARDANTLYGLGVQQKNPLLQAAALTLRSYAFAQLTELWGDIPFTQALQGNTGVYTPKYDGQQTVYMDPQSGIIPSLRRADSLLKGSPNALLGGDLLFKASSASWRRFANALRLRYLLRISAKTNVASEMQAVVTDGAIMQNVGQGGVLALPATQPYNFLSLTERSGDFAVKYMDTTLYNAFYNTGDTARISTYFAVHTGVPANATFSFSNYGGMPMVVDATAAQTAKSSNFNASFTSGSNKNLLMARVITYAEQQFILAEAALKGYISGSPATYYNSGVMAAYAELGLDGSNYLNHLGVIFDNTSMSASMTQIITQKWLVNINNAFEGWIEYRRTGLPQFQTGGSVNLNNGKIPTRFLYPTTEKTINSVNYGQEIQQMGGTENTVFKAWWEK